ncbi:putative 2-aminoethylphosphonate ABC transporter permease subunit [uncultured Clostridium sp.]|uniref:putative 2-aminoethylphosphonate ABC transporter permease subunit n=2 Tax=uncultured Clostridium sp. TaxID=59620 RepID=UPI0025F82EC4|nr:putative 2-aminoethylphosphonate ABC transporter permease subunit [uncultured Clostridium sp.]
MQKDISITKRIIKISILLFLITFLLLPIGVLFFKAFQNFNGDFIGLGNFKTYLLSRTFKISLKNSVVISFASTLISMMLAFLYAYGVNRSNIKCKVLFHWIALLPLFAPTMTHGIALIYLFGNKGILTNGLSLNFNIYGMWGIIISEIIYIFPTVYLMFSLGLKNVDNRLYEVAGIMNTSKFRQFVTITLPSIKFSAITAFFSAFTMAFTDFGAPKIVGGNYSVLATEVYKKMLGQQDLEMGAVVGVVLIIPAVIAFIVDYYLSKKNIQSVDVELLEVKKEESRSRDIIFYFINSTVLLCILIIFGVIFLSSIFNSWPYDLNITTKWFNFSFMGMSGFRIFGNSIFVSIMTAIIGTVLAFIAAYISEREARGKIINKFIYFLSIIPNAIPGLTIGISFMFFFNKGYNPLNFIYGTFTILIIANVIHFLSNPFLTISNELKKIDREYENISSSMGMPWYTIINRVIIPISMPALLESFSYFFVNSMMTVSAVVFLYFPYTRLATISMINQVDIGEIAGASAVAVMIIITNIAFRFAFDKLSKRLKNRNRLYRKEKSI